MEEPAVYLPSCVIRNKLVNLSEPQKKDNDKMVLTWKVAEIKPSGFCKWCLIIALQAPLSMGFFRQEYWSGLLCPPPGDLPDPGIKPMSFTSPALVGRVFTTEPSGKPQ